MVAVGVGVGVAVGVVVVVVVAVGVGVVVAVGVGVAVVLTSMKYSLERAEKAQKLKKFVMERDLIPKKLVEYALKGEIYGDKML